MAFGATGALTINGASAHLYLSDSGTLSTSVFSSFSSFLDEQGTFSGTSFNGFGSAGLTLFDRYDNGYYTLSGTDTISATLGGPTEVSGTLSLIADAPGATPSVLGSTGYHFSTGYGQASLLGGSALESEMSTAAAALTGHGVTGHDTLSAATAGAPDPSKIAAPSTEFTLADNSKITILAKPVHKG